MRMLKWSLMVGMVGIAVFGFIYWSRTQIPDHIPLTHTNLYDSGIDGLMEDLQQKLPLSENLYVGNGFFLDFAPSGEISTFTLELYDPKGVWYTITYNALLSGSMNIAYRARENYEPRETDALPILQETVAAVFLNQPFFVPEWEVVSDTYSLVYYGEREWPSSMGIKYVTPSQEVRDAGINYAPVTGNTLSVTFSSYDNRVYPGAEYWPHRYLLIEEDAYLPWEDPESELSQQADSEREAAMEEARQEDTSYVDALLGYRLYLVDRSAGTSTFSLQKTVDGGVAWENVGEIGPLYGASGSLKFLDEDTGLFVLARSGGAHYVAYFTVDGGETVKPVLLDGADYPVQSLTDEIDLAWEGDQLVLTVLGLRYVSDDLGESWTFVE